MSTTRTIRAPGKLVILGEYAVLDGSGAVVAAVDRGVQCVVTEARSCVIEAPGDDRFVRAALEGAPPGRYTFSDWNPVALPLRDGRPQKAGFGGSAAATVAAVLAAGRPATDAFGVHHAVQGGGSGVDVHAAIHGGVSRFPGGAPATCPPILVVWSGESASTPERVARYLRWSGRSAFVADTVALLDAFPSAPIPTLNAAYTLLQAMARAAGVPYDTEAHQRIAALARDHGGAAKPSGAGGGDVAIALLPDPEASRAFAAACTAAGLPPIPVQVAGPAG